MFSFISSLFSDKKKEPEDKKRGSWYWVQAERKRLHEEKNWSEYYLTRSANEWKNLITVEAGICMWFEIMREGAEKNVKPTG